MRGTYWSGSKFAKWVRGKFANREKPYALGWDEWADWDDSFHKDHPFVFWFTESFLDSLQNFVMWPIDKYNSVRYKFVLRFIDQKHVMNTRLPAWEWYDCDTRILHGMFETLVDFIEVEKAHMTLICDPDPKEEHKWYRFKFLRWNRIRSRELGIKHLNWEMELDNDPEYPSEGENVQAKNAREQLELYVWWKDVRPNRPDPYDVSGYNALSKEREERAEKEAGTSDRKRGWMRSMIDRTDEEKAKTTEAFKRVREIEQQYEDEDTENLIRLVKLRRSLWT